MLNKVNTRKLRNEFSRESFRNILKEELGCTCCNCGSVDNIEYHHIVPVALGGTNKLSNIVPLCVSCHYKAHSKSNVEGIKRAKENGTIGRKHKVDYDDCLQYISDYIYGRIGRKEFRSRCGYSQNYKLDNCSYINKYKKDNNIESFRNIIDVIIANGKLEEGKKVGYIIYVDGGKRELYY